jgi:hypothetical protein
MTDAALERLRAMREVRIETSRGDGAPLHRTIIWVVVDARDRILVRTYRGPGSRWYREALANPRCRLVMGNDTLDVTAERAEEDDRVAACSAGLAEKYAGDPATPAMLRDEVLPTTLELHLAAP